MSGIRSAEQILDDELLVLRAKLLEVAATLDRIDRAEGPAANGEVMARVTKAIETLQRPGASRAEQIQLLFSRPYDDDWRSTLEV